MDFSPETIGFGGALVLLIIKEVRHWTTPILLKGQNGGGKLGERVATNETDIKNIKDTSKEQRDQNRKEHNEIKSLILNGKK